MSSKASVVALVLLLSAILYFVLRSGPGSFQEASDDVALESVLASDLQTRVSESTSSVKLVNMWATWCAPCVEEFPYLLRLREEFSAEEFDLILVSLDLESERAKAVNFLQEQGVDFETYIRTGDDVDFIEGFYGDWSGGLPATFIYDSQGQLQDFWVGASDFEEFREKVVQVLNSKENQ